MLVEIWNEIQLCLDPNKTPFRLLGSTSETSKYRMKYSYIPILYATSPVKRVLNPAAPICIPMLFPGPPQTLENL